MQIELIRYPDHMTHHMYCPNCHRLFISHEDIGSNYCASCGISLEWDNNDKLKELQDRWVKENKSFQELYKEEKRINESLYSV